MIACAQVEPDRIPNLQISFAVQVASIDVAHTLQSKRIYQACCAFETEAIIPATKSKFGLPGLHLKQVAPNLQEPLVLSAP